MGYVGWMIIWAYAILVTNRTKSPLNDVILLNSVIGLFIFSGAYSGMEARSSMQMMIRSLLFSGVTLTIANYLFNWSLYISENVSLTTFLSQLTVVIIYVISIFKYNENINMLCLTGAILILGSICIILLKK